MLEPLFIKNEHSKVRDDQADKHERIEFEVHLWQDNDFRTYAATSLTMFKLDLCGFHVDLPVHHITVDKDRYFNNILVEQHMRAIYKDFKAFRATLPTHAPSVIANVNDVAPFVPLQIRRLLNKKV